MFSFLLSVFQSKVLNKLYPKAPTEENKPNPINVVETLANKPALKRKSFQNSVKGKPNITLYCCACNCHVKIVLPLHITHYTSLIYRKTFTVLLYSNHFPGSSHFEVFKSVHKHPLFNPLHTSATKVEVLSSFSIWFITPPPRVLDDGGSLSSSTDPGRRVYTALPPPEDYRAGPRGESVTQPQPERINSDGEAAGKSGVIMRCLCSLWN